MIIFHIIFQLQQHPLQKNHIEILSLEKKKYGFPGELEISVGKL